jgi:hypothetical protein
MAGLTVGIFGLYGAFGAPSAQAIDPMSDKEAKPAMKERLMEKTVKGDVSRIDGEQLIVRDSDGKEVRLHMDHTTKMDKVVPGDKVKAYYTDQGHVTTLQRLER